MAMLLLQATTLVVVALARSATSSVQRTQLTIAAWAVASEGIESAASMPCDTSATAGRAMQSRTSVEWLERSGNGRRERDVRAMLTLSALAGAAPAALTLRAAWGCP